MATAPNAGRTNASVAAAIGTALAGAVLALITGLGQGIGHGGDTVSTSTISSESSTIDMPRSSAS